MILIRQIKDIKSMSSCRDDIEIAWHIEHGAVYEILRTDGRLAAIVWLSLMPEGMAMISYKIFAGAGKEILSGARQVIHWLQSYYPCILGTIDVGNAKGMKFAKKLGFIEAAAITVQDGRRKALVVLR